LMWMGQPGARRLWWDRSLLAGRLVRARDLDAGHLEQVRREPVLFSPGGALHLVLEVLAYAADEAECAGAGRAIVTVHGDGSVSIADDGRGTGTRVDDQGRTVKKPVMTTRDLRFSGSLRAAVLPDGHPRRGMPVVTALSDWAGAHEPAPRRGVDSALRARHSRHRSQAGPRR